MKLCYLSLLICLSLFAATEDCVSQSIMVPWLTRSADNSTRGWNQRETHLTQASVVSKGVFRATMIPVIGDARGMESQPLQFLFDKFDPPVIDGGQIYIPNYNGGVDLYRLVQ